MENILYVILIVCEVALAAGFYLMIRNELVCKFRIAVTHLVSGLTLKYLYSFRSDGDFNEHRLEYDRLVEYQKHITSKYSYDRMLFSFKPLRFNKWFSEEDIQFLKQRRQFLPTEEEVCKPIIESLLNEIV